MSDVYVVQNKTPSIRTVNENLLFKLNDLIDSIDGKSDPEMVRAVTESVAKLNTSLKGSDIFPPEETEKQRAEREAAATLEGIMVDGQDS